MKLETANKLTGFAIQLLIIGPMNFLAPFAVIFGPVFAFTLISKQNIESEEIAFSFGWIGLIGLYLSVFISPTTFHKRPRLRAIVSLLIIFGLVVTGLLFPSFSDFTSINNRNDRFEEFFGIWYLGGPAAIAIINLYRMQAYSVLKDIRTVSTPSPILTEHAQNDALNG